MAAENTDPWTQMADRLVLEAKEGAFEAQWIDPGEAMHSDGLCRSFFLRRIVEVSDPAAFQRVYVSADTQYALWVNGVLAARGSAHFDPMHQVYDTLDLSALVKPGKNIIAAQVIYYGLETREGPFYLIGARPAFLFESATLKSDAQWKVLYNEAYATPGRACHRGGGAGNWNEKVDATLAPVCFENMEYDDSDWDKAREISHAERWGERRDTSAPWKLVPRAIEAVEVCSLEHCQLVQTGSVKSRKADPPFSWEVKPDEELANLPYTIPADGKTHYVVFQADRLINGFMELDLEAEAGEDLEITYAETPQINWKRDRRDALEDKRVEGSSDLYRSRSGRQVYEPFLHRTFWYVRIAVRAKSPITIHGLRYRWTGYAFPERGHFHCSDESLNRIWEVGWYTQRMCAYDTFQDCPYYERLQYGGDTRIQLLITYYASGDTLLAANAIRQIHASLIPEGLTQSRYPNHVFQVIPGYSLYWIMMLDDYLQHTGDLSLVRECIGGVDSVLRFYEQHQKENGFIANLPYWNFYDWTYEHKGVPGAHGENCTLSTIHYKAALDAGARLYAALGDKLLVERSQAQSETIAAAVNQQAWDEAEGLYWDGIETKTLSKHVNTFAVLFGVADAAKQKRIATRLFDDKALRGTTFYFAHYLHEAAVKLGEAQRFLDDLSRWQGMLDQGASTWWETPDAPRSECHAWSSTPTYRLMSTVLGVTPLSPGFQKVRIAPYTERLEWAEGIVPTPQGDIAIRWEKNPDFSLSLTLPEGVSGELHLPDGSRRDLASGKHRIEQQLKPRSAALIGRDKSRMIPPAIERFHWMRPAESKDASSLLFILPTLKGPFDAILDMGLFRDPHASLRRLG